MLPGEADLICFLPSRLYKDSLNGDIIPRMENTYDTYEHLSCPYLYHIQLMAHWTKQVTFLNQTHWEGGGWPQEHRSARVGCIASRQYSSLLWQFHSRAVTYGQNHSSPWLMLLLNKIPLLFLLHTLSFGAWSIFISVLRSYQSTYQRMNAYLGFKSILKFKMHHMPQQMLTTKFLKLLWKE